MSATELQVGHISGDIASTFESNQSTIIDTKSLQPGQYVACVYDGKWWLSLITELSIDNDDTKLTFMHPPESVKSFFWPTKEDVCWVPTAHILCHLPAPSTVASARQYRLDDESLHQIINTWSSFKRQSYLTSCWHYASRYVTLIFVDKLLCSSVCLSKLN